MRFEELVQFDTKLTADVVEWRPQSNILACATYYLDKDKTCEQRTGCIHLLELNNSEESNVDLLLLDTLSFEKSGILDLKWLDQTNLVTIDSKNSINLITFNSNVASDRLKISKTIDLNSVNEEKEVPSESSSIGLTLDYASSSSSEFKLVSGDTFGNLYMTTVDNQQMRLDKSMKCHDMEIWSILIDKTDTNIVYSGADDCMLKIWDLR